jgi:hypothetical protein
MVEVALCQVSRDHREPGGQAVAHQPQTPGKPSSCGRVEAKPLWWHGVSKEATPGIRPVESPVTTAIFLDLEPDALAEKHRQRDEVQREHRNEQGQHELRPGSLPRDQPENHCQVTEPEDVAAPRASPDRLHQTARQELVVKPRGEHGDRQMAAAHQHRPAGSETELQQVVHGRVAQRREGRLPVVQLDVVLVVSVGVVRADQPGPNRWISRYGQIRPVKRTWMAWWATTVEHTLAANTVIRMRWGGRQSRCPGQRLTRRSGAEMLCPAGKTRTANVPCRRCGLIDQRPAQPGQGLVHGVRPHGRTPNAGRRSRAGNRARG